jgi:hypothetical protein
MPRLRARAGASLLVALLALTFSALGLTMGQVAPTWVVTLDDDPFSDSGLGAAYVEAFAYPEGMSQIDTGLFVACEPSQVDHYEIFVWIGMHPMPARDAFADTIEVLTRREADAVRTDAWRLGDGLSLVYAPEAARAALLDDLRRGGTLALRVLTDPALGARQPTFQFVVDGFAAVEEALDCANAADRDAPSASPAGAAAPEEEEPSPYVPHPVTGLPSLDSRFSEYVDLPERIDLKTLVGNGTDFVTLVSGETGAGLRGIGFQCLAEGGANGVLVTVASPAFYPDEYAYLVLYVAGREVGEVTLVWSRETEGSQEAYAALDADEVGLYKALLFYSTIDAVLLDEYAEVLDYLRLSTTGVAAAINAMPCW